MKSGNVGRTKLLLILLIVVLLVGFALYKYPPSLAQAEGEGFRLYLPIVLKNYVAPTVEFTHIPACRSTEAITGKTNADASKYALALYIQVDGGWWTKPYYMYPLTTIQTNGTWSTNVFTGGNDIMATKFAAFVVPKTVDQQTIVMSGGATFPNALMDAKIVYQIADRGDCFRQISFSGYTWKVKYSQTPAGPGPNYFSDSTSDVFVDSLGRLHLKIVNRDGLWYSTEVINTSVLGYGTYVFHLASRVDQLDNQAVLGLFTWDTSAPQYYYRELDIEFSQWGIPDGQTDDENSQYVVQPYTVPGNRVRFDTNLTGSLSTHGFDWRMDHILFKSFQGDQSFFGTTTPYQTLNYTGGYNPPTGAENVRINLWLYNGAAPTGPQEVIIDRFEFIP